MAEYIEREALIQRLKNSPLFTNFGEDGFFICNGVIDIIKKQPSVKSTSDVVEIVRCKDCIRWSPDGGYGLDLDGTKRLYGECGVTGFSHKENHYCSYGEAKMDGKGDNDG